MLDEKTKEYIDVSLMMGWENFAQRYYEELFHDLSEGEDEHKTLRYQEAFDEQLFLRKRAFEPGFYRYVQDQVQKNETLKRYEQLLITIILTQISEEISTDDKRRRQDHLTVNKLMDKPIGYDRRQLQRITKEYFPELFVGEGLGSSQVARDKRETVVKSTFTADELPATSYSDKVNRYRAQENWKVSTDEQAMEQLGFNAYIMLIDPRYVKNLLDFRDTFLKQIGTVGMDMDLLKYYSDRIGSSMGFFIMQILQRNLNNILSIHWFRTRSNNRQLAILNKEYSYKVTQNDCLETIKLYKKFGIESYGPINLLVSTAHISFYNDRYEDAAVIYETVFNTPECNPEIKAMCIDNLGICYREMGKYKKMITFLNEAKDLWMTSGNYYQYTITIKNIAEANFMLGRRDRCSKLFQEAEDMITINGTDEDYIHLMFNMATSCKRTGDIESEYVYLMRIVEQNGCQCHPEMLIDVNNRIILLNDRFLD